MLIERETRVNDNTQVRHSLSEKKCKEEGEEGTDRRQMRLKTIHRTQDSGGKSLFPVVSVDLEGMYMTIKACEKKNVDYNGEEKRMS